MESILLETRHLTKSFGKHGAKALDQVSLRIPKGCVYGLLGPNGAGKSTFLKIITGMMRPDAGQVFFDGPPWQRNALERIGALIETPPVYPNLTARENLRVRTLALGLPTERIDEVLDQVNLTDTGKKRAGQFSFGMKQRLGIAAALLNRPAFLILDEPTNGLDPFGIEELRELIRRLPKQGTTVLLSSHILSEVEQTADLVGILTEGVLGYQGKLPPKGRLEGLMMEVAGKKHPKEASANRKEIAGKRKGE